ncbi:MAG: hypothetical protein R2831_01440 [Chitinophagaceae bacterium]
MSILELKAQLIEEINKADEDLLYEIKNVKEHHSNFEIPEYVLESIAISRQQIKDGEGVPHEEVMKMAKKWLKK